LLRRLPRHGRAVGLGQLARDRARAADALGVADIALPMTPSRLMALIEKAR
jgi:hypothetical protein